MTNGIHHVTAIAGPARRNLDFHTRVLGQRLVKKTVNFDDPGTYHFYFGDEAGRPGTVLTFFPWANVAPGRLGVGETQETVYRIPESSIGFWTHRFLAEGVTHEAPVKRFGHSTIAFRDPDGTRLALAGMAGIEGEDAWTSDGIPAEHALRGFHSISLLLADIEGTAAILTDVFGFKPAGSEGQTTRFVKPGADIGGIVDLRAAGEFLRARPGAGSVHHVAFRAADDAEQAEMVRALADRHGLRTTEQKDRDYFRSVYFREPGGVLFEIATDIPGFAIDEPPGLLGSSLKLPKALEPHRADIEAALPVLDERAAGA